MTNKQWKLFYQWLILSKLEWNKYYFNYYAEPPDPDFGPDDHDKAVKYFLETVYPVINK